MKRITYCYIALLQYIFWGAIVAKNTPPLSVGQKAPLFSLQNSEGTQTSLSDFLGKKVVFYYFPQSDTPGCTKEACSFRDSNDEYAQQGIVVIGASFDAPEVLAKFKAKYHLPFILVSDSNKTVARQYGANQGMLNKLFSVPKRITYLINEQGMVTHIVDDVNVSTHARDIIALLTKG